MTKNPALHSQIKYIDTRLYFIRNLVAGRIVDVQYYNTHDQLTDILTKSLPMEKFLLAMNLAWNVQFEIKAEC